MESLVSTVAPAPSSVSRLPGAIALLGGATFTFFGAWAMVAPRPFFDAVAAFEPYNEHFILDIGAFQLGLGAVLLLAALASRMDALVVALLGVGVGAAAHTVSHILGRELGGSPGTDIPVFSLLTLLLVAGGVMRWRDHRT